MPAFVAPFGVLVLGHLAARTAVRLPSQRWSWLVPALMYWSLLAGLTAWAAPVGSLNRWLQAPAGHWAWPALALGIGVAHLPFLLMNFGVLKQRSAIIAWLLFALVNGTLEEVFWRGLLLGAAHSWSPWAAVLTISALFAINHPATFGPVSAPLRHPVTVVGALTMGIAWSWVYLSTGSLIWPIAGHILTNLGAMAAPVFMGLCVPPIGQPQRAAADA